MGQALTGFIVKYTKTVVPTREAHILQAGISDHRLSPSTWKEEGGHQDT